MSTPQTQQTKNFIPDLYDTQVREADAQLKVLQAQAEARQAKADMDEISGLTAAKARLKKDIAQAKKFAGEDRAATKRDFEQAKKNADRGLKDLQTKIEQLNERYSTWDEARERRFNARLDEADARMKVWKAADEKVFAQDAQDAKEALATLEEKVALARASAADARREHYNAKSQEALEDAARYFAQAYDAAAKRYDTARG